MRCLAKGVLLCLLVLVAGIISGYSQSRDRPQRLRISDNHRYLVHQDGSPFFWLGDTAWELFHRLSNEAASQYLRTRAGQGFTVIQAVILSELNGLHTPGPYGNTPFKNDDPARPVEAYFKHVDAIIDEAASLGLYIALWPTWGDKVNKASWGIGPEIFNKNNAYVYGKFLGERYQRQWNIIWVLGGDRNPRNATEVAVWQAMAAGITAGVGNKDSVLISFHPQQHFPGGSSAWFNNDSWLDFNMNQSGQCPPYHLYDLISYDYNLYPVRPTMDVAPLYEDQPICFDADHYGFSNASDIRRNFYEELFAGAFGVSYGCNDVWQMYGPGKNPVARAGTYWYDAMHMAGAEQMRYVKRLMMSRPFLKRIPDQSLILTKQTKNAAYITAMRDEDGTYAFIYTPYGKGFDVNTLPLHGKFVNVSWYDTGSGVFSKRKRMRKKNIMHFDPPRHWKEKDCVLVLDAFFR